MLRCLELDLGTGGQVLRAVEKYHSLIDAVEIRVNPYGDAGGPEKRELLRKLCGFGFSAVILSGPYPGTGNLIRRDGRTENLLADLLQPGITHVDIPETAVCPGLEGKAAAMGIRTIRTIFEAGGIPCEMVERVRRLEKKGGIPRVICRPGSSREVLGLIRATGRLEDIKEKIITGQGLFAFFGKAAPWLFGSIMTSLRPDENAIESGEIDPESLERVYRFSKHGGTTRVYGIIGNPVMHTRSPHLHNRWFESAGMDAVYLPFHVDEVEAFMKTAEIIGVLGFSVTVPHKQAVIPALRVKGPELDRIGSCNTVLRTGGGWIGRNTDFEGFLRPLDRLVPGKKFKSALVIGAGGAARAVVYALAERGIPVVIVNRSPGKAEALAAEMGVRWMKTEDLTDVVRRAPGSFDLVVQTTSAGMHPKTEEDPLPGFAFNGSEIVYDIIYAPEKTRFLARAEKAGAVILGGKEMLEAQAERQFELFKKVYSLRAGRKGNSSNF